MEDLIDTFSTSKKQQMKVTEETTVLPESIAKTPDGGNISTYKGLIQLTFWFTYFRNEEMCALANEMGKPELIYKFMNLSSHHALWNTRKGKKKNELK